VWWDAAKGLPEELFVDSIPYRETRGYVRQVLANYAMYQRVSAPPASPQR
jgi:soluble lytic murein transglycosylase